MKKTWNRWKKLQYEKEICFCQKAIEEVQNIYALALLEARYKKLQKNIRNIGERIYEEERQQLGL